MSTIDQLMAFEDRAFVRACYQKLLRRAGDAHGVEIYVDRIRSGASKIQVLEALRTSDEGRALQADLRLWRLAVERQSLESIEPNRRWAWFSRRNGFTVACAAPSITELRSESDEAFTKSVFRVVLSRAPEDSELLIYVSRLRERTSRSAVLVGVWKSQEALRLRTLIEDVDRAIMRYRTARLPLVGWVATAWHGVEGEREQERRARRIENQLAMLGAGGDEGRRRAMIEAGTADGFGADIDAESRTDSTANPAAATMPSRMLLEVDLPALRDGVSVDPVSAPMTIVGWALARGGISRVDVALNGESLGSARYGIARPDVAAAHPSWEQANQCGYMCHLPIRALPDGPHRVELTARSKAGEETTFSFRIMVSNSEDPESIGSIRRRISQVERDVVAGILSDLDWEPSFRVIVVGGGGADDRAWRLTIRSLVNQSWDRWSATILVRGPDETRMVREAIEQLGAGKAWDFRLADLSDPATLGAPLHDGVDNGLVGVLFSGDEMGFDALGAFAVASGMNRHADVLYSDEFRMAPRSARPHPFYKPDYSPSLLLSTNYVGRPLVVRPVILKAAGVCIDDLMRNGYFDLVLRCIEVANGVHHVRELLSRTDSGLSGCANDDSGALASAMARRGISADVSPGAAPETWHVRGLLPSTGKVSIIIPTCAARGHIKTCINSMREVTAHRNFEVICVENIPESDPHHKQWVRDHADRVLAMARPFNWSRFNNLAAKVTDGEFLLFLNDDVEIVEPGWLDALLDDAARPEVGIVGARLLYPNRTVQHAGMFLGENGVGRHAFRHSDEQDPGYFGLALTRREVIAVTGACMLMRRDVFERLGGFDEAHDVINNDLDFCLRAHSAGLLTLYTPYATLIHHERASRGHMPESFDVAAFRGQWQSLFAAGDPYHNPRLSRRSEDYRVNDEGVSAVFAAHPLMRREDVKAILMVKLDHIGDFVTALPAMRRLKQLFPGARITLLGASATIAYARVDPLFDERIAFDFFHPRSQLGEIDIEPETMAALTKRLASNGFDLAVDFRKHPATRDILRCSGARILAGYDSSGRFPWLDIALEYAADEALESKRNHITDDLLNLVAAIDTALSPERCLIETIPAPMLAYEIPEHARSVFAHSVVAVHPGAGNVNKQWPEAHFLTLVDLLVARNDVAVALVGGPDDREIAQYIADRAACPDRVVSVAGDISLSDLPRFLVNCTLFIGNDSGPKHIAAAIGVPTIGIHSGVVSPTEWGPRGQRAVALRRDMTCAPCYLANAEDCPRELACIRLLEPTLVHRMAGRFLARPLIRVPADDAFSRAFERTGTRPVRHRDS